MAVAALSGFFGRLLGLVGLAGSAKTLVEPVVLPYEQDLWAAHPNRVLDPETAANMVAMGIAGALGWDLEALKNGIDEKRFQALVEYVSQAPGFDALDSMLNRGTIKPDDFVAALRKAGVQERWFGPLLDLANDLLTPADLANAYQQGFIEHPRLIEEGGKQGLSADRMQILFELAGLPPGVETAMEMLRRKIIGVDMFAQMVAEGHTKTKYTEQLLALKQPLLTPGELVSARIKQHIQDPEYFEQMELHGLDRHQAEVLYLAAGRPIAPGQATTLARRGQFTFEQFQKAIAQSDIRSEYADDLWKLRIAYPSIFQIGRMVQHAVLPDERAVEILIFQGYPKDIAAAVVAAAKVQKSAKERDLTKSEITTLFEGGFMPRAQASELLGKLGYDDSEVAGLLDLTEARRERRFLEAGVNRVHSQFVGHKLDVVQASAALDQMQVDASVREHYLSLWLDERAANVQRPTRADVIAALKVQLISPAEALTMLETLGYSAEDADFLVAIELGKEQAAAARKASKGRAPGSTPPSA